MLRAGIVSATFKTRPIDEVVSIARSAGLSGIEWSENHHLEKGNIAMARETRLRCLDAGLEIASYGSYYRLGQHMDFRPSVESAAALGAPYIRIWAGKKPSSQVGPDEWDHMVREAKDAARLAQDNGMVVALEWHRNTLTDRNESGLALLEAVASPAFKTFWQPSPEMTVAQRCLGLEMIGPYLANLHVYYWDERGRRPLSEGKEDWRQYISKVQGDHWALLEFVKGDTVEQFEVDARTLLGWI
ncbi:MAG: TIM barrel protein [Sphaerochaetaceae bacterium]|nr:TIM barrel protein [Spirochaetales bacterium]MDY5500694.1 TIM barrel protein [Sphaerochaetaceae bacterium]